MLWITSKLLDEGTEFDLHRLMIQIPAKSIWVKDEEISDRYKAIKDTKSQEMIDIIKKEQEAGNLDYIAEADEFAEYKQIPTNVDASVELIDVSVVNWGGIEKFSKWHDAEISNLRADYLYTMNQEVLYAFDKNNNKMYNLKHKLRFASSSSSSSGSSVGIVKALITNVYTVPFYFIDI